MNSPELWLPSQDQGIQYSSMKEQEAAHKVPLLVENLQAVDSYQEVQEVSFLQCVVSGRIPLLRWTAPHLPRCEEHFGDSVGESCGVGSWAQRIKQQTYGVQVQRKAESSIRRHRRCKGVHRDMSNGG